MCFLTAVLPLNRPIKALLSLVSDKSANFEDHLDVCTYVSKKTPVRLNLIQEVKREKEILVTAEVELAVVGSNGSISKLPKDLLEKI